MMGISSGTKLGRYEIRSKIGEGGMGEVYLAQDTKLDRKVALKILPAEVAAHPDRMKRFVQEAKTASALNHPNIITIYEIDEGGGSPTVREGVHFIATEFIDGETLRRRTRKTSMKVSEVLDVATQIASALSAAHLAGIVHRDIKPENIMLRADGIVKVLDFGLAKLAERLPTDSVDTEAATRGLVQTEPGVVLGTVAYMSPEQARGLAVDARTDIFSLGVVIYELVAGQSPFGGATRSDLIAALLEREPPPLARFTPEAPAELERIVMKALAKDPDQRFQTAKDLLIDLKRLKQKLDVAAEIERSAAPERGSRGGEGGPSVARKNVSTAPPAATPTAFEASGVTSSAEYLVSGIKQHKLATAIALLVLITSAVLLGLYLRARGSKANIDSIAVMPFVNVSNDPNTEYLSDGITESLINSLSQLPNLSVISRSSAFRYKGREVDPPVVGKQLGVRALLMGRVVERGDSLSISVELVDASNNHQIWGEQYSRKLSDLLAVQSDISREISEQLRSRLTGEEQKRVTRNYTENTEAYQLYLQGRFYWNKRNEEGIKKAITYFNQAIEKDPNYALAYSGLSNSYTLLDAYDLVDPREAIPKAKAAAMKALEIDDSLAEAHTASATYYYDWDWPAAEKQFRRAIELNPNYATAHQWYAELLVNEGRFDEGMAEIKRARELDPLSLIINTVVGRIYGQVRQYDQAIEQLRKTIEMDPNFIPAHRHLGQLYEVRGMYPEAIAELQTALTLSGNGREYIATLGHAYAVAGKRPEALKLIEELKQEAKQHFVPSYGIAVIYAGLGEKDLAFEWLEKACEEHDYELIGLKIQPSLDGLRSDARFAELLRRVRLPQ